LHGVRGACRRVRVRSVLRMTALPNLAGLLARTTPGPWEHVIEDGDEWWFGAGNQARIRRVDGKQYESVGVLGGDEPNELADAALIAAAPLLAQALIDAGDALRRIKAQQPETLRMIEANGFVFDSIGKEPGNWQHLAFTVYTDLCEVDTIADACLARLADIDKEIGQPNKEEE
jgi:hypothetical protein